MQLQEVNKAIDSLLKLNNATFESDTIQLKDLGHLLLAICCCCTVYMLHSALSSELSALTSAVTYAHAHAWTHAHTHVGTHGRRDGAEEDGCRRWIA